MYSRAQSELEHPRNTRVLIEVPSLEERRKMGKYIQLRKNQTLCANPMANQPSAYE